ncbi:hypothetical protein N0V86_002278 [Didymella sp. IMI 355093]|nr:hypothetical protein N0V86_002278 [Didymella sp. IMI 355093]
MALTPGMMLVRPSLHNDTADNRAIFRRWTIMHFHDLLNLAAPTPSSQGIVRTLRYSNSAGELFYTIHAEDVNIWGSDAYKNRSGRLDLENTREVELGEEAVLSGEHRFEGKEEPMVWDICNAEFAILEAPRDEKKDGVQSYHNIPFALLSPRGTKPTAPPCSLISLTYTSAEVHEKPSKQLTTLKVGVATYINAVLKDQANGKVYATMYRHLPDSQPDMHPTIGEDKDGNGSWIVCIFVQTEINDQMQESLKEGVKKVAEAARREGEGKWDVKVGIWRGEIFVS